MPIIRTRCAEGLAEILQACNKFYILKKLTPETFVNASGVFDWLKLDALFCFSSVQQKADKQHDAAEYQIQIEGTDIAAGACNKRAADNRSKR